MYKCSPLEVTKNASPLYLSLVITFIITNYILSITNIIGLFMLLIVAIVYVILFQLSSLKTDGLVFIFVGALLAITLTLNEGSMNELCIIIIGLILYDYFTSMLTDTMKFYKFNKLVLISGFLILLIIELINNKFIFTVAFIYLILWFVYISIYSKKAIKTKSNLSGIKDLSLLLLIVGMLLIKIIL